MSRRLNFNDDFLNALNEIIEANLDQEGFGVSELAQAMGMSRSSLHRRVKTLTDISSSQYLSIYRLEKGMELLKNSTDPCNSAVVRRSAPDRPPLAGSPAGSASPQYAGRRSFPRP